MENSNRTERNQGRDKQKIVKRWQKKKKRRNNKKTMTEEKAETA